MSLKIVRNTSRKLKSTVMFVASFALALGSVSFAAPQFFSQTAYATDPAPAPMLTLTVPAATTITRSALVPETSGVPTASNAAVNTATAGLTPIAVTLENTGGAASANVRISPIGADSHIQLWAKDTSGNWFDINVTGWIDSAGKSIPANSGPITTPVFAISDTTGEYPLTVKLVNAVGGTLITSTTGTVTVAPIIHTQADFAAFDGVNIGTNSYTLSSGITATYTGNNTIKLTGYAPIVTPWFGNYTGYNYVTVGIKLPAGFSGTPSVYQTGIMRYDVNPAGAYKMSSIGDGSTPLATAGAALHYLDYSFAANSPNTKKDGLVKLMVIWNVGDAPEYFTIDITDLHLLTQADTTAPVANVTAPSDGDVVRGTINISGEFSDNSNDFSGVYLGFTGKDKNDAQLSWCYQNAPGLGISDGSVSCQFDTTRLTDGVHQIQIWAMDRAQNWGSGQYQSINVIVDNTIPTGSVAYTGGNLVNDIIYLKSINDLKFKADFTDNQGLEHTSYAVWKADSDFQNRVLFCGNWNHAITSVGISGTSDSVSGAVKDCSPTGDWANGSYVIQHVVYDLAGNVNYLNTYPGKKFVLDNTAPNANITSPSVGGYVRGTIDITGAFSDNNHEFNSIYMGFTGKDKDENQLSWCHSEAPGFGITDGTRTCSFDTTNLSDGSHKIEIWAMDKAGNWGTGPSQSITVVVDNTAPIVTFGKYTTDGLTGSVIPNVTITNGDATKYHWTQLPADLSLLDFDNTEKTPMFTPKNYGVYNFTLVATDEAGNESIAMPFSFTYTDPAAATPTDTTPAVPLTQPPFVAITAATDDTAALGATTTEDAPAVAGAQTSKKVAAAATNNDGNGFASAWYWLLAIPAAIGAGWWATAAYRRRDV